MSCMRDVRKRAERTDTMFDPLRETVQSLQGVGVVLSDGVLRQVRGAGGRDSMQAATNSRQGLLIGRSGAKTVNLKKG